ncbi:MAG: hypothetical protein IKI31_07185 [Treponema sp.]|nr:hypothetical protein [Treponema sp.]
MLKKFLIFIGVAFLFASCVSSAGNGRSFLTDKQIKGKTLTGTGGTLEPYTVSYTFNADNTLVRIKNGVKSEGVWMYNAKQSLRPFTLRWLEEDGEKGYMVLFMQSGNEIVLTGDWLLSDSDLTIFEKLSLK